MRKQSKLVPREDLDIAAGQAYRAEVALNAVLNGTASIAYRCHEWKFYTGGLPGCWYDFRFIERSNGYDMVMVTYHCEQTGQADGTHVHDLTQLLETTANVIDGDPAIIVGPYGQMLRDAKYRWINSRAVAA